MQASGWILFGPYNTGSDILKIQISYMIEFLKLDSYSKMLHFQILLKKVGRSGNLELVGQQFMEAE